MSNGCEVKKGEDETQYRQIEEHQESRQISRPQKTDEQLSTIATYYFTRNELRRDLGIVIVCLKQKLSIGVLLHYLSNFQTQGEIIKFLTWLGSKPRPLYAKEGLYPHVTVADRSKIQNTQKIVEVPGMELEIIRLIVR